MAGYGTGAVMAVPAHDTRDFAFAKRYGIPIQVVIHPDADTALDANEMDEAFTERGPMANSGHFDGLAGAEAIETVTAYAAEKGFGRARANYKLKDWSISRQRYWGAPIPIIHCVKCGTVPVPDADLPVVLPPTESYVPKGRSPLADVAEFMHTTCPTCGGEAERDPDTMDTYVCSSWYYLRYLDPHNESLVFDSDKANKSLPIDLYVGGITHATGHLIYFRFFHKFLRDLGLLESDEPATRLFNHGMVQDGQGEVMSKSKGNVVSPIEVMGKRGVDVARLAMFFTAPSEREVMWSESVITGVEKFALKRLWRLLDGFRGSKVGLNQYFKLGDLTESDRKLYVKLNQIIKKVSEDSDRLQFNTCIAGLMELVRELDSSQVSNHNLNDRVILNIIQMVAPMAPHMAEELWRLAGRDDTVFKSGWPEYDPDAIVGDLIELAVQVNGKLRALVSVPADADQAQVEALAFEQEKVTAFVDGRTIVKRIFVPGRIFNIVVKG